MVGNCCGDCVGRYDCEVVKVFCVWIVFIIGLCICGVGSVMLGSGSCD